MKNILKNASLLIVTIALIFSFSTNAQAEECGDLDYNHCRFSGRGDGTIKINSTTNIKQNTPNTKTKEDTVKYNNIGVKTEPSGMAIFDTYKDSQSALFCLDANLAGYNQLYAERFLLNTEKADAVQAYDAAVMSVLTSGGISKDASDPTDYFARNLAIRALSYSFGYDNSKNMQYPAAYYAGLTVTNRWNELYKNEIASLNASLGGTVLTTPGAKSGYNFSGAAVDKAAKYYVEALRAANTYAKKLANMPKVEAGNPSAGEVEVEEVSKGNVFVKKDVVHTIKLSNFSKENGNKFIISGENNGVKLDGNYDGLKAYISKVEINGNDVGAGVLGQDLVAAGLIPENQAVEIKITVHFEGWKSSTNPSEVVLKCGQSPIKYSINGSYSTGLNDQFGEYVGVVWYSDVPNSQRFIGIEERKGDEPTPLTWTSPYETYLIDACNCEDLKDACVASGRPNSNECNELKEANCGCEYLDAMCQFGDQASCEKYETECVTSCGTEFTPLGACCDDANNLVISTSDEEMDPYEIHGNKKNEIKACFVTKVDNGVQPVDEKNNSYKMLTDSSVASNRFCSVNCREDYAMQLPSAKRVNAGRYFTFKTSIEAEKFCFTNTIKRKEYKQIIDGLLKRIENDATIYADYYQAEQHAVPNPDITINTSYQFGASDSCGSCPSATNPITIPNGGHTEPYQYTKIVLTPFIDRDRIDLKQSPQTVMTAGSHAKTSELNYSDVSGSHVGGTIPNTNPPQTYCSTCSTSYVSSYKIVTFAEFKQELHDTWVAAEADYYAAIEELKQTVKEYNACSEWETKYEPKPKVTYDYQEEKYSKMAGMPIDMVGQMSSSPTSYSYCNLNWKLNQDSVNVDNQYESCIGGSGFGGKETDQLKYTKCTLSGGTSKCEIEEYTMANSIYRKSNNKSSGSYIPQSIFYNIYPSGEISISSGDDRVLLDQKLPVEIGRRLGIYEYYVNYTNVGEFYGNGNQGRFMGENGIIENSEYVCAYLVNIPDQEFTCDAIGCKGPDCTVDCIGPNCDYLDCDGTDCVADCIGVGCLYDKDAGSSLLEKTVSLNKLFPYGTDSYNWDASKTGKAEATITAIEEKGNSIYDEEPILSITLDPSSAREIKKYNNDVLNDGGYSNNTVKCQNRNGFEQVVCYSSFIDDMLTGKYGDIVNDNSLIAEESYRHGDNSGYFTLWPNGISEKDMIGPAWK